MARFFYLNKNTHCNREERAPSHNQSHTKTRTQNLKCPQMPYMVNYIQKRKTSNSQQSIFLLQELALNLFGHRFKSSDNSSIRAI